MWSGMTKNRVKYTMDPVDDFEGSDLRNFIRQVQDKKLKPVWRSQPILKRQSGPVHAVVADSYEEAVFKVEKDVVFYVYAPWCGHCKEFDKIYKKLAKELSGPDLLFAKMDGTANDLPPGLEVRGYPTIFFLQMGKKHEPVLYEGDRSYSNFKDFVKEKQNKKNEEGEKVLNKDEIKVNEEKGKRESDGTDGSTTHAFGDEL